MALFHLMRLAWPEAQLSLAHFNHGLRAKTAGRDERFVKKLAAKYRVSFLGGHAGKKANQKISVEEWARERRYVFLKKIYEKKKYQSLLLAHHADDQAETVLMRLCQGTGPRGLSAIREELRFDGMRCVRPLLPFSKNEILKFLKDNRFSFCEDETNQSARYLRNRIRLKVLPYLQKQINPQVVRSLARIPEMIREESHLLTELESEIEKRAKVRKTRKKVTLKAGVLRSAHPALQFRILDKLIKKLDPRAGLLFEHAELIKKGLRKSTLRIDLPRGMILKTDSQTISIAK